MKLLRIRRLRRRYQTRALFAPGELVWWHGVGTKSLGKVMHYYWDGKEFRYEVALDSWLLSIPESRLHIPSSYQIGRHLRLNANRDVSKARSK